MSERKYSVTEIDHMRLCVRAIAGSYGFGLSPDERVADAKIIEEQLRTYMLAGVDPADLGAVADTKLAERIEAERQLRGILQRTT